MTELTQNIARSACPYAARRDSLRQFLAARGLDALLVSGAANRFYLSGFELHDGQPGETSGMLVITSSGRDWLATDPRFAEAAAALWPRDSIFIYGSPMTADMARLLRQCGEIIGLDLKNLGAAFARSLAAASGSFIVFEPADGMVEGLRVIKQPCEIAALKTSFGINHAMFAWLETSLPELAGVTEAALAWEVEKFFREHGASGLAFPAIVACGVNAARPHAIPGEAAVPAEGSLLVDAGCRARDYCSDQTRSWWIGSRPSPDFTRALKLTQKAQQAAFAIMRPGVLCSDVYAAARKVYEDAGAAGAFTHGLGHGVGLETHEAPTLSPRSRYPLRKGMVVTVEPGLYYPAWGGTRQEHTVLVEEDGITAF